ncbi:MAG: FadR family transcriptional regulator [Rhizobiaceae bacterium]|nr:FadR family transcriptional regulator [Rhizobiaceae bacterium]
MAGPEGGTTDTGKGTLVSSVFADLRNTILGSRYSIGEKLPSEAQLTEQYSVSRTVIREAIAQLRADGLVQARQGSGVFVISNQAASGPGFLQVDAQRVSSMIEALELRTAIELESASLAAQRRSPAQEETLYERLHEFSRAIQAGLSTFDADFAFHLAIADATNNPRFREVLEMLGRSVIPRTSLQTGNDEKTSVPYLEKIQAEHREIADAISARNEEGARDAMRTHLRGSLSRYRELLRGSSA